MRAGWLWLACALGLVLAWLAEPSRSAAAPAPRASAEPTASREPSPAELPLTSQPGYSGRPLRGLQPLGGQAETPRALRPPGARPGDGGPSPVIFPAQQLTVRFNHRRHVTELGASCLTCHAGAATSQRSRDSLLPPGTRCDACHGTDHRRPSAVRASSTSLLAQCGYCHLGWREGDGHRVARQRVPAPNLKFSHKKHRDRNIGCQQCHGNVAALELATRDQLPRMSGCLSCHDAPEASRGDAAGACSTCHLQTRQGTLQVSFPSGELKPPRWLHGADHSADWGERHKAVAGADSQLCASCHSERYCTDCHDGRVRPRRQHPNDWLNLHAVAARQDARCSSCHREQSFCLGCHQRAGVTLSGPYGTFRERGRFHPPRRVWTEGPRTREHHGWEAQRQLAACVSCHVEKDCTSCHATAVRGGGLVGPTGMGGVVSPHPLGFRDRCRAALRGNARPCLVCHDPADPALEECR